MSLDIYGNIESALALENFALTVHNTAAYPGGFTNIMTNAKTVNLLGFIDVESPAGSDIWNWIPYMTQFHSDYNGINFQVIGILYSSSATATLSTTYINARLNGAGYTINSSDATRTYIPFLLLQDHRLNDAACVAAEYIGGLDQGTETPPYTYLIYKQADGSCRIVDKWHTGSPDNGNSEAPGLDLILFKTEAEVGGVHPAWNPSLASLAAFAEKRITDHLAAPKLKILPDCALNTTLAGGPVRTTGQSKFTVSFFKKAVGAGTADNYTFNWDNAGTPETAANILSISNTDRTQIYADTYQAEAYQEECVLTFVDPDLGTYDGEEITLDLAASDITDTSGRHFTVDAAENTDPFVLLAEQAETDDPYWEIKIEDDPDNGIDPVDILFADSDNPPVVRNGKRRLTVTLRTAYPTADPIPVLPVASVTKPGGGKVNLAFTDLVSQTVDETDLNADGFYLVTLPAYTTNAGETVPALKCRFLVAGQLAAAASTGDLEGWGFFPREEGAPENCAEEAAGVAGVPAWTGSGDAAAAASSVGSPLEIETAGGTILRSWSRTYDKVFETTDASEAVSSGIAYLEACVNVVTGSGGAGDAIAAYRDTGGGTAAFAFHSTGAGLDLAVGPYLASLRLITDDSDGTGRLALRLFHPDQEVYLVSNAEVDWSVPVVIRMEKDTTDIRILVRPAAAGAVFSEVLATQTYLLPGWTGLYQSRAAFGIFELHEQDVTSYWEFVRYAFFDAKFAPGTGDICRLGFLRTQRAGETSFYRSPSILIGGSSAADPVPAPAANQIRGSVYRNTSTVPDGTAIRVKLRFAVADWDEIHDVGGELVANQGSVGGFFRPGFIDYYRDYSADIAVDGGFLPLNTTRSAVVVATSASGASTDSPDVPWSLDLEQDRLSRRLFIIGAADAPLLPTPTLVPGVPVTECLLDDTPVPEDKEDLRCAVRQFLPDFYVRDRQTDDGSGPTSSSSSPDIILGVFAESGTAYADFDPSAVPDPAVTAVADIPRYPAGFARDASPVLSAAGSYSEIDDQKGGKLKTVPNAWVDYGTANYFNRVWIRLSNRGVVPGPAWVQVFYGDAQLRADFNLTDARDAVWEEIIARNIAPADPLYPYRFVQFRFVRFGPPADGYDPMEVVEAIPALSGYSTPDTANRSYTIADFKWNITAADWAAITAQNKAHGCLTAFINHPDFSPGIDTARRWDGGNFSGGSVWPMTYQSNNIAIRNTNIVQIVDPGEAGNEDFNVTLKSAIGADDDPVNYVKSPVNYRMSFASGVADWGLALDGRRFKAGDIILRLPRSVSASVKTTNFTEIIEYAGGKTLVLGAGTKPSPFGGITGPYPGAVPGIHHGTLLRPYRFFLLARGTVGAIGGLSPGKGALIGKPSAENLCQLYFRPDTGITPALYQVEIMQTVNRRIVGSYITELVVLDLKKIAFIGDIRTGAVRKFDRKLLTEKVIPYQFARPLSGLGAARLMGFRPGTALPPVGMPGAGKPGSIAAAGNELANVYKTLGVRRPTTAGILGPVSVTGKVLSGDGRPAEGLSVILEDPGAKGHVVGACAAGEEGYFSITLSGKTLFGNSAAEKGKKLKMTVYDGSGKVLAGNDIRVEPEGLFLDPVTVSVPSGGAGSSRLKGGAEVREAGYSVRGTVVPAGGGPRGGYMVLLEDQALPEGEGARYRAMTDADGRFAIRVNAGPERPVKGTATHGRPGRLFVLKVCGPEGPAGGIFSSAVIASEVAFGPEIVIRVKRKGLPEKGRPSAKSEKP